MRHGVIRGTADTNVYISALVFAGAPRRFLMGAEAGRFQLAISDAILNELRGVLRSKFAWAEAEIAEAFLLLSGCTMLVQPVQTLDVVSDGPDDNRVVECAVTADSRFIVTGDGDLLRLGSYGKNQILNVADFLRLLEGPTSIDA